MRKRNERGDWVVWLNHWLISGPIVEVITCFTPCDGDWYSVRDCCEVNKWTRECTGKCEQVNCSHEEMRSHLCMNPDCDLLTINCAALLLWDDFTHHLLLFSSDVENMMNKNYIINQLLIKFCKNSGNCFFLWKLMQEAMCGGLLSRWIF